MSILKGISILLALLLVKTRASGTRNGIFEANIHTACITLSAWLSRPQRLIYSRRRAYIPSAVRKKGSATHTVLPLIMILNDN